MAETNRKLVSLYKKAIICCAVLLVACPWGLSIGALWRIGQLETQLTELTARLERPTPLPADDLALQPSPKGHAVTAVPPAAGLRDATKIAYLTFDDGPSQHTTAILQILRRYGVRATFFVVGRTDSELTSLYRTILAEGHALGIHSYTHRYEQIYASSDACLRDIDRLAELLVQTTGVQPTIYRFPGGSSNSLAPPGLIADVAWRLAERDMQFFDWNVDSGDGRASQPSVRQLVENVVTGAEHCQRANILLHDHAAKQRTVRALPEIIEALQAQGFVFDRLSRETEPTQHRVFATVSLGHALSSRREQPQHE